MGRLFSKLFELDTMLLAVGRTSPAEELVKSEEGTVKDENSGLATYDSRSQPTTVKT